MESHEVACKGYVNNENAIYTAKLPHQNGLGWLRISMWKSCLYVHLGCLGCGDTTGYHHNLDGPRWMRFSWTKIRSCPSPFWQGSYAVLQFHISHKAAIIHDQCHQPVVWWISYSWLSACQGEMKPLKDHLNTSGHLLIVNINIQCSVDQGEIQQ